MCGHVKTPGVGYVNQPPKPFLALSTVPSSSNFFPLHLRPPHQPGVEGVDFLQRLQLPANLTPSRSTPGVSAKLFLALSTVPLPPTDSHNCLHPLLLVNLAPSTTSHAFKICVNLPTWPPPSSVALQVIKFQSIMNLDLRNIASASSHPQFDIPQPRLLLLEILQATPSRVFLLFRLGTLATTTQDAMAKTGCRRHRMYTDLNDIVLFSSSYVLRPSESPAPPLPEIEQPLKYFVQLIGIFAGGNIFWNNSHIQETEDILNYFLQKCAKISWGGFPDVRTL
ncbi:hypothetical protein B0H14DRAFT_3148697 [Mycena olivaceomarginata]|nr:hypothetical protein B0H14DRAFT_3148697 [Mycena olivaceomarginata]